MSREDWEIFDEIKEERRQKRQKNLEANTSNFKDPSWNIHTEYHWSKDVVIEGKVTHVDYWPSSNKWKVGNRYYRGGLPKALKDIIHGENRDTRTASTSARIEDSETRTENPGTRKE